MARQEGVGILFRGTYERLEDFWGDLRVGTLAVTQSSPKSLHQRSIRWDQAFILPFAG
jgi:hypothetical protein